MKKLLCAVMAIGLVGILSVGAYARDTIIYYLWDDPTYKNIVEEFNNSQDEIFVDAKIIPAKDYPSKILTLLAGGVKMDVYMNKRQVDIFPMIDNGYVEPLDELIKKYKFDLGGISVYKDIYTVDGEVYALPLRGASWYTYYNKRVFEQAGVPTPDTFVEKGKWTWEKFVEIAEQLATGDGKVYGALMYIWSLCQSIPATQRGIQYITADGKLDVDDSLIYSFKIRKKMESKKAIMPLVELLVTKTHYSKAFWEGNVGMLLIGEWFPGMMIKARDENLLKGFTWHDWGLTRLPCNEAEYRTVGMPTCNHLHPDSKKKEIAFKFISWMAGAKGAEVVAKWGFLPPRSTPEVQKKLASVLPDEKSLKYFIEPKVVLPGWFNKYAPKLNTEIQKLMEEYLLTDMTDNQFMETVIKKRFENIIKATM